MNIEIKHVSPEAQKEIEREKLEAENGLSSLTYLTISLTMAFISFLGFAFIINLGLSSSQLSVQEIFLLIVISLAALTTVISSFLYIGRHWLFSWSGLYASLVIIFGLYVFFLSVNFIFI